MDYDKRYDNLFKLYEKVNDRVENLGYERYDYGDILDHRLFRNLNKSMLGRRLSYIFRFIDLLTPLLFRKILGVKKTIVPTTFYHLGISYMQMQHIGSFQGNDYAIEKIGQLVIDIADIDSYLTWKHPYNHHASNWKSEKKEGIPLSCAHHGTRLGRLLLLIGKEKDNQNFIKMGMRAVEGLINYHNWHKYNDETCTISYYPVTEDEVINTSADMAALLAEIPFEIRDDNIQKRLSGLTKMIVNEQQQDGSWFYCTERHYGKFPSRKIIDNHHTAMNLSALAIVYDQGNLNNELKLMVKQALKKGMYYYFENFYDNDGTGSYFPKSKRETEVVGYCEGIVALQEVIQRRIFSKGELESYIRLLPKMVNKMVEKTYIEKTADISSMRRFGLNYNIQSIRWGAGPFLHALSAYLLINQILEENLENH